MKVAVLCKSDQTGGAAVTSRRLTEALNTNGVEATLLVIDQRTDYPFVERAGFPVRSKIAFLSERLHIFCADGFSRKNLFRIDTGEMGLPLWRHPAIKRADAVIINWVNQGMLSLNGVKKICGTGKKVIWTMHDMWNFTGICHHSMGCQRYMGNCGECPLLGSHSSPTDLSRRIFEKKKKLYSGNAIEFVAVSTWLRDLASRSSLLKECKLHLIPNAFDIRKTPGKDSAERNPYRILFVAARLDDSIKGLSTLRKAMEIIADKAPEVAKKIELELIGNIRDKALTSGFTVKTVYHGPVESDREMGEAYARAGVVVSASDFENLPGTLVEGQAYGCLPVAFDRGGQKDIITHLSSGYLAAWSPDMVERAENLAKGIEWALSQSDEIRFKGREEVEKKFSYDKVAKAYIRLL